MIMRDLMNIVCNIVADRQTVPLAENQNSPLDNRAFRRWFGNSKVVDEHGNPLVLYHGTNADIHSFKGMVWGSVTSNLASEYAQMRDYYDDRRGGANVMPIYMRVEYPFNADLGLSRTVTVGQFFNAVMEQGVEQNGVILTDALRDEVSELLDRLRAILCREEAGPHFDRHDFWNKLDYFGRDGAETVRRLYALLGFDGIQMYENGELTFGAFSTKQVKSALGNKGTFSTDSENITEQR